MKLLVQNEIDKIAKDMVKDLQDRTPVLTGRARDGWEYDKKGKSIVNHVPYISFLNVEDKILWQK